MNFSQITDRLFIGGPPSKAEHDLLQELGVRLVICMRFWLRPGGARIPSVHYLSLPTFDSPLLPIPVQVLVQGAAAALEVMEAGGKVYTYCARGRHRSVAMGAAILIAEGLSAERAMTLIKQRRTAADPQAEYIRRQICLFEKRWSDAKPEVRGTAGYLGAAAADLRSLRSPGAAGSPRAVDGIDIEAGSTKVHAGVA